MVRCGSPEPVELVGDDDPVDHPVVDRRHRRLGRAGHRLVPQPPVARALLVRVRDDVPRDAEEPGGEPGLRRVEPVPAAPGLDEHLLRDVLGVRRRCRASAARRCARARTSAGTPRRSRPRRPRRTRRRAPRRPRRPGRAGAPGATSPRTRSRVRSRTAPHSSAPGRRSAQQLSRLPTDRLGRDDDVVRIVPDVAAERASAGHEHEPWRAGPVEPLVDGRPVLRDLLDGRRRGSACSLPSAVVTVTRRADAARPAASRTARCPSGALSTCAATTVAPAGSAGRGTELVPAGAVGVLGDLHLAVVAHPDRVDGHVDARRPGTTSRTGGGVAAAGWAPRVGVVRPGRRRGDGRGVGRGVAVGDGDAATAGSEAGSGPVHAVSRAERRAEDDDGREHACRDPGGARTPSRAATCWSCGQVSSAGAAVRRANPSPTRPATASAPSANGQAGVPPSDTSPTSPAFTPDGLPCRPLMVCVASASVAGDGGRAAPRVDDRVGALGDRHVGRAEQRGRRRAGRGHAGGDRAGGEVEHLLVRVGQVGDDGRAAGEDVDRRARRRRAGRSARPWPAAVVEMSLVNRVAVGAPAASRCATAV